MEPKKFEPLWSSFAGFRKVLASALKEAGAPDALVSEVGYIDCEDAGVASDCFQAYEAADYDLKDYEKMRKRTTKQGNSFSGDEAADWEDIVSGHIHDCVIDCYDSYSNLWNYAPGHKPEKIHIGELAEKVCEILHEKISATK